MPKHQLILLRTLLKEYIKKAEFDEQKDAARRLLEFVERQLNCIASFEKEKR